MGFLSSSFQTWFEVASPPRRFFGAISAMNTGTCQIQCISILKLKVIKVKHNINTDRR